jgi:hypothetical protein
MFLQRDDSGKVWIEWDAALGRVMGRILYAFKTGQRECPGGFPGNDPSRFANRSAGEIVGNVGAQDVGFPG